MIKIICIGKKHEAMYEPAIACFEKRLSQWQKIEWVIIQQSGKEDNNARDEESDKIISRLSDGDFVIVLDETGKNITSPEIAGYIEKAQNLSRQIVYIIGGAYGVNQLLRDRADAIIAFGQAVFPHQLMRVILLEQLYRACSINAGSGYHHS